MKAVLEEGFWGDELCLVFVSMMWQVGITVVKGETFHQIKFRHSNLLKETDLTFVQCQGWHYIPASKFLKFHTYNHSLAPGCAEMDKFGAWMDLHGAQTDTMYTSHLKCLSQLSCLN